MSRELVRGLGVPLGPIAVDRSGKDAVPLLDELLRVAGVEERLSVIVEDGDVEISIRTCRGNLAGRGRSHLDSSGPADGAVMPEWRSPLPVRVTTRSSSWPVSRSFISFL